MNNKLTPNELNLLLELSQVHFCKDGTLKVNINKSLYNVEKLFKVASSTDIFLCLLNNSIIIENGFTVSNFLKSIEIFKHELEVMFDKNIQSYINENNEETNNVEKPTINKIVVARENHLFSHHRSKAKKLGSLNIPSSSGYSYCQVNTVCEGVIGYNDGREDRYSCMDYSVQELKDIPIEISDRNYVRAAFYQSSNLDLLKDEDKDKSGFVKLDKIENRELDITLNEFLSAMFLHVFFYQRALVLGDERSDFNSSFNKSDERNII